MNSGAVLYVEDEQDDIFLVRHAFKQAGISNALIALADGEAALDYLNGRGMYSNRSEHPVPILLLLDINMPLVSGLEVLKWVRSHTALRALPALMLSSSSQPSDIRSAYELGANGYLVKPSALAKLLTMVESIRDYWLLQNQPPPDFEDALPLKPEMNDIDLEI
jgi:CheY-like chemotaxis protein